MEKRKAVIDYAGAQGQFERRLRGLNSVGINSGGMPMVERWMEMLREGGEWLGAARNWIKWNVPRGDQLKWGSDERVSLRVNQIEELTAHAAAAAVLEEQRWMIDMLNSHLANEQIHPTHNAAGCLELVRNRAIDRSRPR